MRTTNRLAFKAKVCVQPVMQNQLQTECYTFQENAHADEKYHGVRAHRCSCVPVLSIQEIN